MIPFSIVAAPSNVNQPITTVSILIVVATAEDDWNRRGDLTDEI